MVRHLLVLLASLLAAGTAPRADTYGDALPPGARARLGTVRWRHEGGVEALAFSPDGKALAAGGMDDTVRVRDLATGAILRELRIDSHVRALAFSRDGKSLAVGCQDKTVRLWPGPEGDAPAKLGTFRKEVIQVAFSPDGRTLACTGVYDDKARFWDVKTGKEVFPIDERPGKEREAETGTVTSVAFSPDGKTIATGRINGAVLFWSVATGKKTHEVVTGLYGLRAMTYAPDGRTLAMGLGPYRVFIGFCELDGPEPVLKKSGPVKGSD